jgi:hypothetical protein
MPCRTLVGRVQLEGRRQNVVASHFEFVPEKLPAVGALSASVDETQRGHFFRRLGFAEQRPSIDPWNFMER